jgi:hypothetical protein
MNDTLLAKVLSNVAALLLLGAASLFLLGARVSLMSTSANRPFLTLLVRARRRVP